MIRLWKINQKRKKKKEKSRKIIRSMKKKERKIKNNKRQLRKRLIVRSHLCRKLMRVNFYKLSNKMLRDKMFNLFNKQQVLPNRKPQLNSKKDPFKLKHLILVCKEHKHQARPNLLYHLIRLKIRSNSKISYSKHLNSNKLQNNRTSMFNLQHSESQHQLHKLHKTNNKCNWIKRLNKSMYHLYNKWIFWMLKISDLLTLDLHFLINKLISRYNKCKPNWTRKFKRLSKRTLRLD